MAVSGDDQPRDAGTDPRWAWPAVLLGAWILAGVVLVTRALNRGDAQDVGLSPYHVLVYTGLLALGAVSVWLVVRARRRGIGWRRAFPAGLGSLGAGFVVLVATLLLDVAWREGVGIDPGISNGVAPSRVLLVVGLVLVSMAPLRASLLAGGDRRIRWPATVSAGLVAASLAWSGGLSPIANPWLERPPDIVQDNSEIWLMDADGGRQTRLVEAAVGVEAGNPAWSPDGTKIAYTVFRGPADDPAAADYDIWVVNADGTDPRPIASGPAWQWFPRWSPDGAWLEYTEEAVGGPWLSSGPVGPDLGQGPQGPAFPGVNAASKPEAELWRLPADGGGSAVQITNVAGDDRSGSWSPDGNRIAFDSTRDGNTEVYAINADGSGTVRLTDTPAEDWSTSWSPDGSRIAFSSDRSGIGQIWVMNADGTGPTQLTDEPSGNIWPVWSPTGDRIAFTSWRDGQQVWSMAADGSDLRNLSRSASTVDSVWDGSWGPDGRIAFTRAFAAPAFLDSLAREDLGVAGMLLSALALAIVAGLLALTRPPFGAYAVTLGIASLLTAVPADAWRFVPAAVIAGLVIDVAARLTPERHRVELASGAAALALVVAVAATSAVTTGIGWSPTILIGVALAAAIAGWGIGALIERHAPGGASSGPSADLSTDSPSASPDA